jgi:hypothetical protein
LALVGQSQAKIVAWKILRQKPEIALDALVKAMACWLSGQAKARKTLFK